MTRNIVHLTSEDIAGWKSEVIPDGKKGSRVIPRDAEGRVLRFTIEGVRLAESPSMSDSTTTMRLIGTRQLSRIAALLSDLRVPDVDPVSLEDALQWQRMYRKQPVILMRFPAVYERIRGIDTNQFYTLDVELLCIRVGVAAPSIEWKLLMLRITDKPFDDVEHLPPFADMETDSMLDDDPGAFLSSDEQEAAISALEVTLENSISSCQDTIYKVTSELEQLKKFKKRISDDRSFANYVRVHNDWAFTN